MHETRIEYKASNVVFIKLNEKSHNAPMGCFLKVCMVYINTKIATDLLFVEFY